MAAGLGMTPEEWEDLKSQVNDSFWVMRVIGAGPRAAQSPFLKYSGKVIRRSQAITTVFHAVLTGVF